jgi:L-rhamnonate dehydratase
LAAISAVDLAIWDLLGKLRNEPVYKMIGGRTKSEIPFYCTGPFPAEAKRMGFWGGKVRVYLWLLPASLPLNMSFCQVPLPYAPSKGHSGLKDNLAFLKSHRDAVGPDFPIMVDCYMSLNVPYAISLARGAEEMGLGIYWFEECLHPDDFDGQKQLKQAMPHVRWTTGEHEYSKYGFRKLIEDRVVDIIQPDVMWLGGLTELLKVSAHAAAYDIPVVPHGSGPYS